MSHTYNEPFTPKDGCSCRVWNYLGDNNHICANRCGSGIINAVPDGGVLVDHDCDICNKNAAALKLTDLRGLSDEEIVKVVRMALSAQPATHHAAAQAVAP